MRKLSIIVLCFLVCGFLITLLVKRVPHPNFVGGKYDCVEHSQNKGAPSVTSHLYISQAENGQYKFHWDYSDNTHYDGMSAPKKRPSSGFIIEYSDLAQTHLAIQQAGFEAIEVKDNGKVLMGKFSTMDHKDAGDERCKIVEAK